jgi:hypothetical protein
MPSLISVRTTKLLAAIMSLTAGCARIAPRLRTTGPSCLDFLAQLFGQIGGGAGLRQKFNSGALSLTS